MRLTPPILVGLALVGTAACAPEGPYPSLAPRPIEKALADSDDPAVPAPLPDDPGLPGRIEALAAQVRRGEAEYRAAYPPARNLAAKAGGSGSDSWIEAQQALSRLEAARATITAALQDLDALALAETSARPLSPADQVRLNDAIAQAQSLSERQRSEIVQLQARIGE